MENKVASLIWAFTPSMIKSSQIQKAQIQIHFQIQYHFHFIFHHPRTVRNTTLYKTSSSTSTTFTTSYKLTSSVTLSLSLSLWWLGIPASMAVIKLWYFHLYSHLSLTFFSLYLFLLRKTDLKVLNFEGFCSCNMGIS